jgi:hypothetical protein
MRLNCRASVSGPSHSGQRRTAGSLPRSARSAARWSSRQRRLHFPVQSTSGSLKPATCPLATQTWGFMMIEVSIGSMSSRSSTMLRHQRLRMFRRSRVPSGPKS